MSQTRTATSGPTGPECERVDCHSPAVVVLEDRAGGRMNACPDCHQEALRRSGGLIRGVGLVARGGAR